MPEMTVTIVTSKANAEIGFSMTAQLLSGDNWDLSVFVDGVELARRNNTFFGGSLLGLVPSQLNGIVLAVVVLATGLTPGSHTFTMQWRANAGTARAVGTQRSILVHEV